MVLNWASQTEPDQQEPTEQVEYRVKVVIAYDLPNGLRTGDEFTPTDPRPEIGSLEYTRNWWVEHGHAAAIQTRVATTSYSAWETTRGD